MKLEKVWAIGSNYEIGMEWAIGPEELGGERQLVTISNAGGMKRRKDPCSGYKGQLPSAIRCKKGD